MLKRGASRTPRKGAKARKPGAVSLRRARWDSCLILLNGELGDPKAVRRLASSGTPLLCADGGARHAAALGIEPNLILGDMDSLSGRRPRWKRAVFMCDFDPNLSDFEKALRFAAGRGMKKIWVAGTLGGRPDHQLVNWALLERYSELMEIHSADMPALLLGPGKHRIACRSGQTVTLLSIPPRSVVTTSGLLYPLRNSILARSSRGLSNRATADTVGLHLHSGRLWVIAN